MTFPDAYQEAICKLKLVLPDSSHVKLEEVLRGVYVAALEAALSECSQSEIWASMHAALMQRSICCDAVRALIEQVQGECK